MSNPDNQPLRVWTGRHVQLELLYQDGSTERLELDVVEDKAADFERGFLGESTPLAKAVLGRISGSRIPYRQGDIAEVRILAVEPELKGRPEDLTERREENLKKALRQSQKTSATIFASSVNNKWGDYDPDALPDD